MCQKHKSGEAIYSQSAENPESHSSMKYASELASRASSFFIQKYQEA